MDISPLLQGSHATASPSGQHLTFISNGHLRICAARAPERCTDIKIRIPAKDITAIQWNEDGTHVAVVSARNIEIVDLDDASHRVRLDNGSAGLGRFASADFVGKTQLLVTWEFGKAKLWNLSNGRGVELCDVKTTCDGDSWQTRPDRRNAGRRTLAVLSRPGADDLLNMYSLDLHKQHSSIKVPTADARSLSWSPDGRWLAILDSPMAPISVHFFTPDGHHFRSYPTHEGSSDGLGVKSIVWSPDLQTVALTRYDGRIALLNTKTFTPLAIIEHTTTIDQRASPSHQQAPIWQEAVSASGERSYAAVAQPVSPPLSRTKPSTEPSELGVAEASFSCDGSYLATRDERMLNTVWIWDMSTLGAHAVLIQHSNVRKLHWHPTQSDTMMVDCGEGIAYLFSASSSSSPSPLTTSKVGSTVLSWLPARSASDSTILASTKSCFMLMWPEGRPDVSEYERAVSQEAADEPFDEGASEDSLFDVLSGRKPLPPRSTQSYTERIDIEVETEEEDSTTRMDDTFREKKTRRPEPLDPLDDSDIF
ncbi:hypothetical protein LTR37_000363 [Vermiconidia calcicola]|uniref:Uncharacterized protein n=1 Tax=Vermiconidia calcicola TaxID=1690605 RepID=A0ACC3NYR9_9PEZI|nr:hypothetical protein LTR37_000363 [Vermiconidia calcicola]